MGTDSAAPQRKRFRVSLYTGAGVGVFFGLISAYLAWQPIDRYTLLSRLRGVKLPEAFLAQWDVWNRTHIFLTSVVAYAVIGAILGAVLGWFRTRAKRPAQDLRKAFARDLFSVLFLVVFTLAAGYGPGYVRRAETPVQEALGFLIGLAVVYVVFRFLAWVLGRLLTARPVSFVLERAPWKPLGALAAAGLVLFALLPPLFAPSPPPPSPPDGRPPAGAPNVLMIVLDAARADRFSCYGYAKPTTPEIDRIAADALLFEQAISAGVYTLPGHASLFTGAPSSVHGANGDHLQLDPSMTTLAEILDRNGYVTAGFSNNPWVAACSSLSQGFRHFEDHWRWSGFEPLSLLLRTWDGMKAFWCRGKTEGGADYTFPRVLQWIEEIRSTEWPDGEPRPYFVFINLMETHFPLTYRPDYSDAFMGPGDTSSDLMRTNQDRFKVLCDPTYMDDEAYRRYGVLYDGELRFADHYLGEFVRGLARRGWLDDTLLVIPADHGEAIGDHGLFSHRQSVYDELTRVPLILRHPRIAPAGRRIKTRVQTFDRVRTILDFVGIEEPLPPDAVLARNLLAEPDGDRWIVSEEESAEWAAKLAPKLAAKIDPSRVRKRFKALYSGDMKYIWESEGGNELYALAEDPRERHNLAAKRPDEAARMERALETWLRRLPANRMDNAEERGLEVDRETQRQLRSLGYIQ